LLARPAFMAWLEALTQRSGRLVLLRLRRFAGVNDLLSVAGGDRVLRTVAARLVEATRGQAAPARMGNTEFAVYLTDDSDPSDLARLLAEPYHVDGRSLTTDVAVGIAHDDPTLDVETLLARADMAVRTVIGRGDTVGVFEPTMSDDLLRNVEIEQALRGAGGQEFWLAYQPIVDARTGALVSLEALIRWDSPHLGRLAPGSFIGAAERFGLSDLISEHVVQHLLDDLDQLPPDVSISINCSASEFQRGSALEEMLRGQRFGPLGRRLAVEVTEGAIFRDPAAAAQMIDSLVELGMDLYLDDFGTGFANFSRLVSWPFAGVKLDRSLVQLLEPDPRMRHLVEAVVLLADSGGMHVVAEGVETAGELQQCVALGCHRIQGYLVAKPMGVWDLQRWMELVRTDPEWSPR
jgi:diguanylate cyclase (GGDEF)-like protein